jgi:hypothetical protein
MLILTAVLFLPTALMSLVVPAIILMQTGMAPV